MITSEEVRKSFNTLVGGEELKEIIEYPPNGNWHKLYLDVERYITQQEKVNELLELYRLKDKLQDDKMLATPKRRTATSHVKIAEINNKIYDIKDKIMKLESELHE